MKKFINAIWLTIESRLERLGSELSTGRSLFVVLLKSNSNFSPPYQRLNITV